MFAKIKIGDKEIEMTATGATPMHYRNCFNGHDLLVEFAALEDEENDINFGMVERLAYIMSGAFKERITLEAWLEQFGPMDIVAAMEDIIGLYTGDLETQSESKNVKPAGADS